MLVATLLMGSSPTAAPPPPSPTCGRKERVGDAIVVTPGPERLCRRFHAPRSYDGVWIDEFEGSRFVEGARTVEEARARRSGDTGVYWFSLDERSRMDRLVPRRYGTAYRVRVIAQEMLPEPSSSPIPLPGFGHMGMWHRAILVNEVRDARVLHRPAS